jgi:hypothetical protein
VLNADVLSKRSTLEEISEPHGVVVVRDPGLPGELEVTVLFELELAVEGLDLDIYLRSEVVLKLRLQEGRYVPGRGVVVGEELYVGVLPQLI